MRLNHASGSLAEDAACRFLRKKGFSIVARNWHCPYGEIDIIAQRAQLLLFVEVKYRKNAQFGGAAYSITPAKLGKIANSTQAYLTQHPHRGDVRVDAVLIQGETLQHIENIMADYLK